jgi:hypothetical protein
VRAAALLLLCGCYVINARYVGPPADPKPEGCPVRQIELSQREADEQYEAVGWIWGSGHVRTLMALEPMERAELERVACGIGGDIVLVTASEGRSSTEWRVYRERRSAHAATQ